MFLLKCLRVHYGTVRAPSLGPESAFYQSSPIFWKREWFGWFSTLQRCVWGLRLGFRVKVKVWGWGMHYLSEGPRKHRSTNVCCDQRFRFFAFSHLHYTSMSPLISSDLFKRPKEWRTNWIQKSGVSSCFWHCVSWSYSYPLCLSSTFLIKWTSKKVSQHVPKLAT